MNRKDIEKIILQEAKYIKNLVEEKKKIECQLEELKTEDFNEENIQDESLSTAVNFPTKKSMPKRLDEPDRLKEEKIIDFIRKSIRKQLYESYKIK